MYLRATQLAPNWDRPYVRLAHIYQNKGDWQSALNAADQVCKLNSKSPEANSLLANIRHEMQDAKAAERDYESALLLMVTDRARAISLFSEAVKLRPNWDAPYVRLAELVQEDKHDNNGALKLLNKACALNPQSYSAKYARGRFYYGHQAATECGV